MKEQTLKYLQRVRELTRKVLHYFPKDKGDYRPRPYWDSPLKMVVQLALTEQKIQKALVEGKWEDILPPLITHWEGAIQFCEDVRNATSQFALQADQEQWQKSLTTPQGKTINLLDFLLSIGEYEAYLRGQLVVYGRLAGGHIPEPYRG
ncbi:MAG: DinB family protein [bacterium JZ-2024 1]